MVRFYKHHEYGDVVVTFYKYTTSMEMLWLGFTNTPRVRRCCGQVLQIHHEYEDVVVRFYKHHEYGDVVVRFYKHTTSTEMLWSGFTNTPRVWRCCG